MPMPPAAGPQHNGQVPN